MLTKSKKRCIIQSQNKMKMILRIGFNGGLTMLKCSNCNYCYQTPEDDFPCCHYIDLYDIAPCEYDDDDGEEEE